MATLPPGGRPDRGPGPGGPAGGERRDGATRIKQAEAFLKQRLAEGPVEAHRLIRDARDQGISESTLRRAKAHLGVRARRQGESGRHGGGRWVWELPGPPEGQEG